MTDAPESATAASAEIPPEAPVRPEELPPVEPPSAGYIVQLFLIPALIVAAVIGVWFLFGRIANEDTNWEQLVVDLGSSNEHRRWRAALGLAQVLRNQQIDPNVDGDVLADQPKVATALTDLLSESLSASSPSSEDIKHQEFLARTLGALNADEVVLPTLAKSMSAERSQDVRKSSLMSIAMIAGRHFEKEARAEAAANESDVEQNSEVYTLTEPLADPTITNEDVLSELRKAAQDEDPGIRHLAAYSLALVSGHDAIEQLKVMLLDGDSMARANAAVGLARNGSADAIPALTKLIVDSSKEPDRDAFNNLSSEDQQSALQQRQFEQPVILSNCIRAVDSLLQLASPDQKGDLKDAVQSLLDSGPPQNIRVQAQNLAGRLE